VNTGTTNPGHPVRFGLIYTELDYERLDTSDPARRCFEPHWAETLEHMTWAESVGFDSIWLTEHHFDGFAPSPLLMAAAVAARTKRVRIATNVMLAPLYHAVRLAEEASMVAVMSNGRFDLGIGAGYNPVDFARYGVELRHRPSLMEETVAILRRAWTGERFSFHGKRYSVPGISVVPVPAKPPRILIGAFAPAAIERAARIGDGYLGAFNEHIGVYETALRQFGRSGTVCAGQQAVIAEDIERTWSQLGTYAVRYCNIHVGGGLHGDVPNFTDPQQVLDRKLYNLWDGPTAVAEITKLLTAHPSIEDISFMVSSGPGEPLANTYERLQFLIDVVVPEVRRSIAVDRVS
jgi:alkanesulfonate monooxygenase SsuD/methylene tetrahydromethanopterin reductase-like flavin-dependent oxidoreductase (luciferase family)